LRHVELLEIVGGLGLEESEAKWFGNLFGFAHGQTRDLTPGAQSLRYAPVSCRRAHAEDPPRGPAELVCLLVDRGARLDLKDLLWQRTAADWARHAGDTEIEACLCAPADRESRAAK
jgi:hypothetical protein